LKFHGAGRFPAETQTEKHDQQRRKTRFGHLPLVN
jgi:hypothetical protein